MLIVADLPPVLLDGLLHPPTSTPACTPLTYPAIRAPDARNMTSSKTASVPGSQSPTATDRVHASGPAAPTWLRPFAVGPRVPSAVASPKLWPLLSIHFAPRGASMKLPTSEAHGRLTDPRRAADGACFDPRQRGVVAINRLSQPATRVRHIHSQPTRVRGNPRNDTDHERRLPRQGHSCRLACGKL